MAAFKAIFPLSGSSAPISVGDPVDQEEDEDKQGEEDHDASEDGYEEEEAQNSLIGARGSA